jgi:hypothetical protein
VWAEGLLALVWTPGRELARWARSETPGPVLISLYYGIPVAEFQKIALKFCSAM